MIKIYFRRLRCPGDGSSGYRGLGYSGIDLVFVKDGVDTEIFFGSDFFLDKAGINDLSYFKLLNIKQKLYTFDEIRAVGEEVFFIKMNDGEIIFVISSTPPIRGWVTQALSMYTRSSMNPVKRDYYNSILGEYLLTDLYEYDEMMYIPDDWKQK